MKRLTGYLSMVILALVAMSCKEQEGPVEKAPIVYDDANVDLADQRFGMYYGDLGHNGTGIYNVVLSDAVCFRDGYGDPYLDSEGVMLVFEFHAPLQDEDANIMIPSGTYAIDQTKSGPSTINLSESYIKMLSGDTQYHYDLVSGNVVVGRNSEGTYDIYTENLVIAKGSEQFEVQYSYSGSIYFDDWKNVAVTLQGIKDDIIDMPFDDVSGAYYGNLFGYGTGNYVINLSTAGFIQDETGNLPGVLLVLNMFDELVAKDNEILLNEGTYTVYPSFNPEEFSMLYGMNMDGMPFGTYLFQIDADGAQALEFISEGTVKVTRGSEAYSDVYTFEYDLATSSRKVKGQWSGTLEYSDVSTDSDRVILSTLDGDVECDMHRIDKASLYHIETLKTTPLPSIDIAEAWQLTLQPRGWTEEEKQLPWEDRLKAWDPNGDIMIFEFVVPLDSKGDIAPEINKEYSYQIQPNLAMDEVLYVQSVSKMGRPYDDIFYQPNWKDYTYMTGTDARRGFTWDGGFRGNWYLHFEEGSYQAMDEMAPAVKGTVKVTRLTELSVAAGGRQADFKIVWDLYDDTEASYNITGEWTGPVTVHTSEEIE
jgi:hypothetical protein